MGIDIADAAPEQRFAIDEMHHLLVRSDGRLRQFVHGAKDDIGLPQIAEGELAQNIRMPENLAAVEQPTQRVIAGPQMVDPDRSVDQDHLARNRRRGAAARSGSLPPSRARRRALSRSISALSASRTRADFSRRPVYA